MAKKQTETQTIVLVNSTGVEHELSLAYALNILRYDISKYKRLKNWKVKAKQDWVFDGKELVRRNTNTETPKES